MGYQDLWLGALAIIGVVFIASRIRVANETERFVVSTLGCFAGLKGPGLVLKWPSAATVWARLRLGEIGEFLGDEYAQFGALDVPVRTEGDVEPGQAVRVTAFRENEIWVCPTR